MNSFFFNYIIKCSNVVFFPMIMMVDKRTDRFYKNTNKIIIILFVTVEQSEQKQFPTRKNVMT